MTQALERSKQSPRVQASQGPAARSERFFLFERSAPGSQPMEVQWEQDHSGAVESFLLPDLAATTPYPKRAKYLPPDRWVLIDPESDVPPMLVALTRKKPSGFSHYLVGVADWPEGTVRAHGEFWHTFTPKERAEIERMWTGLERTK